MKKLLIIGGVVVVASIFLCQKIPRVLAQDADSRARVLHVYVDGQTKTVVTQAKTVGEALQSSGIILHDHDKTEPNVATRILANDYRVSVFRARPITVVDGSNTYTITTAERTPRAIAETAGFDPQPEDGFEYKNSDSPFEGAPGTRLYIKRSKPVVFELYGKASKLRTQALTVKDLLDEKALALEEGDEVSPSLNTRIAAGMKISLASIDKKVTTIEEPIPFQEQQIQDANQPVTFKQVQKKGKNGRRLVTYEVVIKNGKTFAKKSIKQVILEKPVSQVVRVGSRPFNGNVSADKQAIMAKAGIAAIDYDYVDYIVGRESGWRVDASNGATWGLCQALPGSKMSSAGADWQTNPITQMRWCNGYAVGRYGSWAGAYSAWQRQGWW